jgi:hypothetical protein
VNRKHWRVLAYALTLGLGCVVLFSAAIHKAPRPTGDAPPPSTSAPRNAKPLARPGKPVPPTPRLTPPPKVNPPKMDDYVVIPDDPRPQVFPPVNTPEAYEISTIDYRALPPPDASRAVEERREPKRDKGRGQ